MKTYNEITRILAEKRLAAPTFMLNELTERDDVIEGLNQQLVEKDATINALREALNDARDSIQVIDAHGENPWDVSRYCERAIEFIDAALGEGEKHE